MAGARELLECLPRDRWAVVTSADRGLPETRMHLAGLPRAPLLVAAEDVQAGKPVPDGYRIAAENLGLDCEATVVFENSDTSILAGRNAGCPVIAVTATRVTPVLDQIDWIENFASISVECTDRDVSIRVT